MIKKSVTYTDFAGKQRTEDFYFHFTKAELLELELSKGGGLKNYMDSLSIEKDGDKILAIFSEILLKAVGVKSPDDRRFIKNEEIRNDFHQTEAFSSLLFELATNTDASVSFMNSLISPAN